MSRRSAGDEMMKGIADGCIFGIFLALWAAIAALIVAIVKGAQTSPEDQLRKMGSQQVYGAQIVGQPCPTCEEPNEESAMLCFRCGGGMSQVRTVPNLLDLIPIDKIKATVDEFGQRPSIFFDEKTLWDAEIPIAVGIVGGLFLLILIKAIFTVFYLRTGIAF